MYQRTWKSSFALVFLANMSMYLGMQMVDTMIAVYADHLGADSTTVGLVTSLFAVTALVFKVISGPAIDAFRKKYVILVALIILGSAFLGLSFSVSIPSLMFFRLLQGVGRAFSATCFLALVSEILPKDCFTIGIGFFTVAQAFSQAVSPTMGLLLSQRLGFRVTFFVSFGFILLALILTSLVPRGEKPATAFRMRLQSIVAKEALFPAGLLTLLTIANASVTSFLVLYGQERGLGGSVGLFFSVYAGALLVFRPLVGTLQGRLGTIKVMVPALFCYVGSFLMISWADSLPEFLIAAIFSAFGFGALSPAIQALCMKSVSIWRRGAASNTSYIGTDIGALAGPILSGYVAELAGYETMWKLMTLPVILTLVLILLCRRRIAEIDEGVHEERL